MKIKSAFLVVILLLFIGGGYWFYLSREEEKVPIQIPSSIPTSLVQTETSCFKYLMSPFKDLTQIFPESFVVSGKLKVIDSHSVIIEDITGEKGEYQLAGSCRIYHIERGDSDFLKEIKKEDLKEEEGVRLTVKKQENSYFISRIITDGEETRE